MNVISEKSIETRKYWVENIESRDGVFSEEADKIERELGLQIDSDGSNSLIDHLRLCGNIPESYSHDSTQEKLYSKYTDSLLCFSYKQMGLRSLVLTERADFADVDAFAKDYSFVADAKAFRLSRTAKNQKDFKVQAMDGWKHGKPYAMVVCPIYQLPNRKSQIYQQASTRNVCIFTYSHLSLLVNYALEEGCSNAEGLLYDVFRVIPALNPSKSAIDYWLAVNKTILGYSAVIEDLWRIEKEAVLESIQIAKEEGLRFLASEREKIMRMSHEEALSELVRVSKINQKIETIESIADKGLFTLGG